MKTKFNGILTLLLAFLVQISFAQEKTISGTVTDDSGGLPGVSITVKGSNTGTESDFDGNYTIKTKTGDVLIFRYLGYKPTEKTVGTSNTINVKMVEDANVLDEVVVVGYGTSTKQAFTGTATVVNAENLQAKSVSNISQALVGEVAGVTVVNGSGQPGTTATVRIRGFGSINGNSAPLYIVDGVPYTNALSNINPSDIESTTVLKDATATSIYGSRGSNGVIVITTKKGKSGVSDISLEVKTGVNMRLLPSYDYITSPDEYIETAWESLKNTGDFLNQDDTVAYANNNLFSGLGISSDYNMWNISDVSELIDPTTGLVREGVTRKYTPEKWADYGYQSAIRNEVNLTMSGGNDKTTYFSSFGYLSDKGYVINSDYKRYTTRLNLTHKPTDWLEANANIDYTYAKQTTNGQSSDSGSVFWFTDNIPAIYPLFLRDDNGDIIEDPIYGGPQYDYGLNRGFGGLTNAIADATYDLDQNNRHSINGNFSFKVNLMKGLTFTTKYSGNYYAYTDNTVNNPFYGSAAGQGGSLFQQKRSAIRQNILQMFNYETTFGDNTITALLAHESNIYEEERTYISKNTVVNLYNGLTDPTNYVNIGSNPSGYTDKETIDSYFGQVNYNYAKKYFLSGSLRRDGSSRFYRDKWGTFWSAGASWIITNEDFMDSASFVDYLKLKFSYGIQGDNRGVSYYSGQDGYDIDNLDGDISLIVRAIQNPDLTWESGNQFQVGTEFTLFNNFLDGNLDYYVKNTNDLIFSTRIAISTGDALLTVNDGSLRNSGLEFDFTAHLLQKENFKIDLSLNGQMIKNELTSMPYDNAEGREKIIDISSPYGRATGHSRYDFYMPVWAGVDPADGSALWEQNYYDSNSNGAYDDGEEILSLFEYTTRNPDHEIKQTLTKNYTESTDKYVGKSAIPDVMGAFRLSAEIYDFSISTQFSYSLGGYSYDYQYAGLLNNDQAGGSSYHTDIRNRWQNPGDITDVPRLYSNQNVTVNSLSTRFLTSSDYLALNNIRLGYSIPTQLIANTGISNLNIWLSGDNLFLLSARDGFNPSTSVTGASSTYRYSPLSTFTLGVRIKF
ncbi:SusC/RagA family TonB-linked outer membrane protein [Polaribacter sargassicola]|uniref:SusC/RagA family TonB-linked outer membrane protein n=1 Tax=Polaribacter sargassicola TaxID=2836891 RepID=UPI001F00883D|nr:SusC/RagA family TonB-linked outer membrane protein [Polaribacter sp. DS7-9]MCG1035703.1 SusC/RagA family TonB-linked outer membrane protein [Polaribacter sp. DS7-9]